MEKKSLKIVCISDTHNHHRELELPSGDLLIHAGDFTKFGKDEHASDFDLWLSELPFSNKIVVGGNHECSNLRPPQKFQKAITHATFLWQQGYCIDGWKIFGSSFFWPFKVDDVNPYYDQIPFDTNILVVHGPPLGILDGGIGKTFYIFKKAHVN
jgi:3',5'-cyclic AMP phosphodiesterase CpdA